MFKVSKKNLSLFHEYSTYLFFFLLSFPNSLLSIGIGIWAGSWLIWRVSEKNYKVNISSHTRRGTFVFLLFVLFNFSSIIWGDDYPAGLSIIEHRLSFLLLSLIVLLGVPTNIRWKKIAKAAFIGSVCSLILFSVVFIYRFFFDGSLMYHVDVNSFSTMVDEYKHPAYLSLNLCVSLALYFFSKRDNLKEVLPWLLPTYFVFLVFIYLSNSRAGIVNMLVLSIFSLLYYGKTIFGKKKIYILLFSLVLLFVFGVTSSDKFNNILDNSETVAVNAPRKVLWTNALDLAKEKPFVGYGIGSSKNYFVNYCSEHGLYNADLLQYNTHNQFLEFVLESGLISLCLLFFTFIFYFRGLSNSQRIPYLSLLALLSIAFLFESMLLRIAGITVFVAVIFFTTRLIHDNDRGIDKSNDFWIRNLSYLLISLSLLILSLSLYSRSLIFDSVKPSSYVRKNYVEVAYDDLSPGFPLTNNNIIGAKFDSTSTVSLWSENAYMLNLIANKKLKEDENLVVSVYCYVSPDFDGSWARLSIDLNVGGAIAINWYNLKKKGTWQKLTVTVDDKVGEMPAYFYFCKENANSFEDLKGYVLFAYPEYTITKKALDN